MKILILFFTLFFSFSSWGFFKIQDDQANMSCEEYGTFTLKLNVGDDKFELVMEDVDLNLPNGERFISGEIALSVSEDDSFVSKTNDNRQFILIINEYLPDKLLLVIQDKNEAGNIVFETPLDCVKIEVEKDKETPSITH